MTTNTAITIYVTCGTLMSLYAVIRYGKLTIDNLHILEFLLIHLIIVIVWPWCACEEIKEELEKREE